MMFSPLAGAFKSRIGGKNLILVGFFLMTATSFGLGMLSLINYPS
jgi:hypothetical protein